MSQTSKSKSSKTTPKTSVDSLEQAPQANASAFLPLTLPWQQPLWQNLTQRFPDMGHALLFYGKNGCGKSIFQQHFMAWVLCQNKQSEHACGECQSCHWLKAGTHPQLKIIRPDYDEKRQVYSSIKIEQIRELVEFTQQTVEGWRIIVIEQAEKMNIASANALLKTLEEPGERVLFILNTAQLLKLPATIRSRVQQFALDRISQAQALDYLQKNITNQNHSIDEIKIALAFSADMPLQAIDILEQDWFVARGKFIQQWLNLVQYKNQPMRFAIDNLKQLDFQAIVQMVCYTIQDCIALKLQQPYKQSDMPMSELAQHYQLSELFDILQYLNTIPQLVAQNVQSQLIIDQLAMYLMNVQSETI
ncbi:MULTISPECIES: DNA polymerase III subunit delta' [unclassified Acinetobacter]|uniref:DNA polymerase III subunit delta' n=1 Tax=unclassified Acinetobacter TaxID=196816 RepID=UPI0035BA8560